jgi:hypothetical protein
VKVDKLSRASKRCLKDMPQLHVRPIQSTVQESCSSRVCVAHGYGYAMLACREQQVEDKLVWPHDNDY